MDPQVVRYSEQPELWDEIGDLSGDVWPEYNLHGETLNYYWRQLYDVFPDWQFVLYDPGEQVVLAEGHTIPLDWDGSDAGLGPSIDASLAAAFESHAAGQARHGFEHHGRQALALLAGRDLGGQRADRGGLTACCL